MSNEIKEISNRICQNCKYHYIEEISFDYPQSCCNKTNPNHTTEKWLNCDNFEYSEDYITNLQQAFENSYTEEQLDFAVNEVKEQLKAEHQLTNQLHNEIDKLRVKNYELQQENERLKTENALVSDRNNDYRRTKEYYKSIVEKATEKVNNISFQVNGLKNQPAVLYINLKDTPSGRELLNILQGGKDE